MCGLHTTQSSKMLSMRVGINGCRTTKQFSRSSYSTYNNIKQLQRFIPDNEYSYKILSCNNDGDPHSAVRKIQASTQLLLCGSKGTYRYVILRTQNARKIKK